MKKKHRKNSKGRTPRKAATHAVHASRSKRGEHERALTKSAPHSVALLRAIKRRRAAEHGEHTEHSATRRPVNKRHKRVHGAAHKHSHASEPVVTEKSFENMLAYRRFQNHAR
jgi:hypothetical protein